MKICSPCILENNMKSCLNYGGMKKKKPTCHSLSDWSKYFTSLKKQF